MSESPAGKGDKRRPYDRKGYDESKLWVNLEKKKQYGEPVNHKVDWDKVIEDLPKKLRDNYEE